MYILAELNFFGNYSHPRDLDAAFRLYHNLADLNGNSTAQYMLGVYYSTGLGNVVPADQAKALLYYNFAAAQGDLRAEMALGYRHHAGIGAIKNCNRAVESYRTVAQKAMEWYESGPLGGMSWVSQSWRIADETGGIFGEGASASSSGINAFRPSVHSDANAAIGDVIEYLDLMSQKGDYKAAFNLGRIWYEGQRGLDQNLDLARKYFFLVVSKYWGRDGSVLQNQKPGVDKVAKKAAGYIGRMYSRGEGVPLSIDKARAWWERGHKHGGDAQSQYGLALLLIHGLGGAKDVRRGMSLLEKAAEQDYAPAQVEMGVLYLDQGGMEDLRVANNYFELAARYWHIASHYYLAEMAYHGVGREQNCAIALNYYKNVAERAEPVVSSWADANEAYESGDHELAFLEYLLAAEQGFERAQTNVAFMLDTARSSLPFVDALKIDNKKVGGLLDNPGLALVHWTRSSRQSYVDSLVKSGDYYYYGIGTDRDINKAVQCYTGASEHAQSAQALYNLGWMHENGVGLKQDFHLAKRYYDHALAVNKEAYLPVKLSLLKLRLRSAWNDFTHGGIHSIQEEPSKLTLRQVQPELHANEFTIEVKKDWSLSEWIANFIALDGEYYEDDMYADEYYDDDTIEGGGGDFSDEGVIESLLIIGVMTAIVFLLWWRQRLQNQHQQAEEERRWQQRLPPRDPQANGQNPFPEWAGNGLMM